MRSWRVTSLVICLFVFGLSSSISSAFAQAKPVELNYSIFFPAPHKATIHTIEWAKEIEKRTQGMVKITVFPGGTLTPPDKSYDGIVKRISDAGLVVLAYTRGKFPLSEVVELPLGLKSATIATRLFNEFYRKFHPAELDGVKVLYFYAHGPGTLHTTKPVNSLQDLKGMKIRCTGLSAKAVTALGGTPVAMPTSEAYDALSRGVVDGTFNPFEALSAQKLGEVTKYSTKCASAAYTTGMLVAMNKSRWNALPPDIQKLIEEMNEEWIQKAAATWEELDRSGVEFANKSGNQIITLSKEEDERWAKAVRPILDEYVNNMKAKGLPGEEALKFCLDYLKENQ